MEEGSRLHKEYQQSQTEKYNETEVLYKKEVKVKEEIEYKNILYIINGRIDSVLEYKDKIVIEEIKSVGKISNDLSLENNKAYLAQLLLYAYFLSKDLKDEFKIEVMMTYISRFDEMKKSFSREITKKELLDFFMETIEQFYKFTKVKIDNDEIMEVTGKNVEFPYDGYRQSQRKFMSAVYNSISNKNKLFAQAPTGVGKTLSTIFPSIKALSNKLGKKIFYITAKSITKNVCLENLQMLEEKGYKGISLDITSKENICTNNEINCNASVCPRASGHFDKLNQAILDIVSNEKIISKQVLQRYATKYEICPYYFQLELIDFVHIVVCDYNYVYNPSVCFTKYFDKEKNDFIVLVDEAHNLESRSRDFFSASIKKSELTFIKNNIDNKSLKNLCNQIIKNINSLFQESHNISTVDIPKNFVNSLFDLRFLLDEYFSLNELDEDVKEQLLNAYFSIDYFLKTSIYFDEKYRTLYEIENNELIITLFCVDTSTRFFKVNTLCRNVVFFSATLSPINYFADLFGGDKEDYFISLDTSFDISKQLTLINDKISTFYKDRDKSYEQIAKEIYIFTKAKVGNYFVFFPSYSFLNNVLYHFEKLNSDANVFSQSSDMSNNEREKFLNEFERVSETTIGFMVSGGVFSEGVNLVGEKLIGCVVVGVGIQMLNFKSDVVKSYYDYLNGKGYEFAYMYQGFNKILQSAGRVIRSEEDRGAILFIDTRYKRGDYRALFPKNYENAVFVNNDKMLSEILADFWS